MTFIQKQFTLRMKPKNTVGGTKLETFPIIPSYVGYTEI